MWPPKSFLSRLKDAMWCDNFWRLSGCQISAGSRLGWPNDKKIGVSAIWSRKGFFSQTQIRTIQNSHPASLTMNKNWFFFFGGGGIVLNILIFLKFFLRSFNPNISKIQLIIYSKIQPACACLVLNVSTEQTIFILWIPQITDIWIFKIDCFMYILQSYADIIRCQQHLQNMYQPFYSTCRVIFQKQKASVFL